MSTVEGVWGSRAAATVDAASAARGGDGSVCGVVAGESPCGCATGRRSEWVGRDRRLAIMTMIVGILTLTTLSWGQCLKVV